MLKAEKERIEQMNFYSEKNRRKIAAVIVVILVIAMVVPLFSYAL